MALHNQFGADAEKLAVHYLERKGYEILEENWTNAKCEVDIIAYYDEKIIFVEVKARKSSDFGQPEDFVDQRKQKQLEIAAEKYIELMDHKHEIRFDIISLLYDRSGKYSLKHIEDAFWPE